MTLQDEIDAIEYPPTHRYKLEGLVPLGPLADRVKVIEEEFPEFFTTGSFLDVGCNKGFFTIYHLIYDVTGIDPDRKCIELCKHLQPYEKFYQESFGEFNTSRKFDKIFIGNGHHYPFIEAGGWSWVKKLSNLCVTGGQVLLEGPIDMRGEDAKNCIPEEFASIFTKEKLLEAFTLSSFSLVKIVPSPLVHRYFLLFRKDEL